MSLAHRLVIANRPCQCFCPCAVLHRKTYGPTVECRETMPVRSTVGAILIDYFRAMWKKAFDKAIPF